MSWSKGIRQMHRWTSIVFTACVLANVLINVAFAGREQLALWVGLATLVPLFVLLLSGLYLFALPYARRGRGEATLAE